LIPIELLNFENEHKGIISKGFGGFALTNNEEDSKQLIEKFRISSV
jgi:hypothetical protein